MKVIYVVLVCLLAFTSCAETEYAENGVDKKNITGYTEVGFYSLDGICTFTEQEQLQAAINPKRLTYRLQNSDQSKYIHVKFDGKPTAVGQKIKTEFSFQGVSFLKEGMEMEVVGRLSLRQSDGYGLCSVMIPSCRNVSPCAVLNVDPGGYTPIRARFKSGLVISRCKAKWFLPRWRPIIKCGS